MEGSQRESARNARRDASRQLRAEITSAPYPARNGLACSGASNVWRLMVVVERRPIAIQRNELTRSPITAVLMVQQTKVQPKLEQKAAAAEARAELWSSLSEEGIEMRNTRSGLVCVSNLTASRTRSNHGKASQMEWALGEAGKVKSTPSTGGNDVAVAGATVAGQTGAVVGVVR
jgi:hypothetical protein